MELSRCHICAALLPDTEEDRRDHVSTHKHIDKRLDAMTQSLRYLNGEIEAANARIEELDKQLAQAPTTPGAVEPLVINEFPEDELDPEPDLAPPFAEITDPTAGEPIEDAADTDDELDARIANLNAITITNPVGDDGPVIHTAGPTA